MPRTRALLVVERLELEAPRIAATVDRTKLVFVLPSRRMILRESEQFAGRWNELLGRDGRLFQNGHTIASRQQQLDGIGEVLFHDVMIAPLDAE